MATAIATEFVRELEESDLVLLQSARGSKPPTIRAIRERHHALARCLALGLKQEEAARTCGYCISRVSILMADPTFKELVTFYTNEANAAVADFQDRATQVALTALDIVAERLEDTPEDVSTGQALEIAKVLGDRTGHAPVTRNLNANVNIDLAGRLERAKQRIATFQPALPRLVGSS